MSEFNLTLYGCGLKLIPSNDEMEMLSTYSPTPTPSPQLQFPFQFTDVVATFSAADEQMWWHTFRVGGSLERSDCEEMLTDGGKLCVMGATS